MKKYLIIAALVPALAGCATHEEANVPTPTSSPHEKDPKAFCYAGNTVYSEGATWNGKTCRRDNAVITPGVTNNLIWR